MCKRSVRRENKREEAGGERRTAAGDDKQHRDSIRPQHLIDKSIQASSSIDVMAIRQRRTIRAQDAWACNSDAISLHLLPHQMPYHCNSTSSTIHLLPLVGHEAYI
jgi:hypothetical protein